MKYFNFKNVILFFVVLLAGFLRFYKLSQIPNGFYVDEAAIGYNSYSILMTLKDEYGKLLPIFIRSYGAYSSPLYTYISTIPIKIFGLSIFSARFLSAVSGTLSVLIFYLVVRRLRFFKGMYLLILGTFLFAILPWNIFFSRGAFEANLAFFILLVSLYFYFSAEGKFSYIFASVVLVSLSTYAYQSNRLIAFLLLPIYLLDEKDSLKNLISVKSLFLILTFLTIQIPELTLIATPAFKLRAIGLFYGDTIVSQASKIQNFLPYRISFLLAFVREFLSQFTAYISPRNLFWLGDEDPQRSIPDLSVFYSWMVIPYLVGLIVLLTRLKDRNYLRFFLMSLVFVIPAGLTRDPFSTLRSLPFSFSILVMIMLGLEEIFKHKVKFLPTSFLIIFIILSFLQLWRSYFVLFPKERARVWGYGFDQLMGMISHDKKGNYLVDQTRIKPGYIQYLFFTKYEPHKFQEKFSDELRRNYYENLPINLDYEIENVKFSAINWNVDAYKKQIIIGDEFSVSADQAREHFLTKVFEIKDPIGEIVFIGYQTDPQKKCDSENYKAPLCGEFRKDYNLD